jgi:uncharacterized protein involved in type VI secretion and phage assembly
MRVLYDLPSYFAGQILTAQTEAGRVYEPVIGIVTDNKDPQKLGRVKLQLPVLSEQDATTWAPIIMLGAGKNRGWFFIPDPGDEVLVLFEHGDVNRPLVVGALWNGKDKPPDSNPSPHGNDRRVIKSRAGSRIVFDDGSAPKVVIEDGAGKARITIDSSNNRILIEALDGDVCFQSPTGDLSIVAKSAELKAGQNVELHSAGTMAWGADGNIKVTGPTVTFGGPRMTSHSGGTGSPQAPQANPKDVDDPYGS